MDNDTIEITRPSRSAPSVRDSISTSEPRKGQATESIHKRRASNTFHQPFDFQQPAQKRARQESEDVTWRPSGGAKKRKAKSEDRAVTRLSTSAIDRTSFTTTRQTNGRANSPNADVVRPEEIAPTIREVFANMSQDLLLDMMPKCNKRIGTSLKEEGEYSTNPQAVANRQQRTGMSAAETILSLRERCDTRALLRVMKHVKADRRSGWDRMSEQEQVALKEEMKREVQQKRDERGRSAAHYTEQLVKLAVSCVGAGSNAEILDRRASSKGKSCQAFPGVAGF